MNCGGGGGVDDDDALACSDVVSYTVLISLVPESHWRDKSKRLVFASVSQSSWRLNYFL